jgi:hypothetical protein
VWFGGPGSDFLVDLEGIDEVNGGRGSDFCLATKDNAGGDTLRGGQGTDVGDADPGDQVQSLETRVVCFAE